MLPTSKSLKFLVLLEKSLTTLPTFVVSVVSDISQGTENFSKFDVGSVVSDFLRDQEISDLFDVGSVVSDFSETKKFQTF